VGGEDDEPARVLPGMQLDAGVSIVEQLKQALSTHLEKVTRLFTAWDQVSATLFI